LYSIGDGRFAIIAIAEAVGRSKLKVVTAIIIDVTGTRASQQFHFENWLLQTLTAKADVIVLRVLENTENEAYSTVIDPVRVERLLFVCFRDYFEACHETVGIPD
jgi:hypothetical protein